MPYLILVIGLMVGVYALIRFFAKAEPKQIRTFFRISIIAIHLMILLFFALTGRVAISIALFVLAIPFIIPYFKKKILSDNKENKSDE